MTAGTTPSQTSHQPAAALSPELSAVQLLLASRSPRRKQLLAEHGYRVQVIESGLDDGLLRCGRVTPAQWVAALAYLKAEAGLRALRRDGKSLEELSGAASGDAPAPALILGADTTVVAEERIIGQPIDADDARRILRALSNREHAVVTGVSLVDLEGKRRTFFHDAARVQVGELSEAMIEDYIVGERWRGKAGAYNLRERLEAGWPIRYEGDPTTIMGLPMGQLGGAIQRFCQE